MTLKEVFANDSLNASHLFDGAFTIATHDKTKHVALSEAYLIGDVGVVDTVVKMFHNTLYKYLSLISRWVKNSDPV